MCVVCVCVCAAPTSDSYPSRGGARDDTAGNTVVETVTASAYRDDQQQNSRCKYTSNDVILFHTISKDVLSDVKLITARLQMRMQ